MADHVPTPRRVGTRATAAEPLPRSRARVLDLEAETAAQLISAGSDEISKATELIVASTLASPADTSRPDTAA